MSKVKKLTLSAILTALTAAMLYAAAILPMVRTAITAAAGLLTAVALIQCGTFWSVGVYVASGLLALLLLPDKSTAVWYLLIFGHYGIMKSLIERLKKQVLEWVLKVALFSLLAAAMWLLFKEIFLSAMPLEITWLLPAALVVFMCVYDIAFSALIHFYYRRIKPHINS